MLPILNCTATTPACMLLWSNLSFMFLALKLPCNLMRCRHVSPVSFNLLVLLNLRWWGCPTHPSSISWSVQNRALGHRIHSWTRRNSGGILHAKLCFKIFKYIFMKKGKKYQVATQRASSGSHGCSKRLTIFTNLCCELKNNSCWAKLWSNIHLALRVARVANLHIFI